MRLPKVPEIAFGTRPVRVQWLACRAISASSGLVLQLNLSRILPLCTGVRVPRVVGHAADDQSARAAPVRVRREPGVDAALARRVPARRRAAPRPPVGVDAVAPAGRLRRSAPPAQLLDAVRQPVGVPRALSLIHI